MGGNSLKAIREVWTAFAAKQGFAQCFNKMEITAATEKTIEAEFTVTEDMANIGGNLHGGATATIADVVSTLGLMLGSQNRPGVSVNLSINYLKGAKIGEQVIVASETLRVGKTLAYLDIKLKKKVTGELIASGSHVKHLGS